MKSVTDLRAVDSLPVAQKMIFCFVQSTKENESVRSFVWMMAYAATREMNAINSAARRQLHDGWWVAKSIWLKKMPNVKSFYCQMNYKNAKFVHNTISIHIETSHSDYQIST